jgi:hypothetical protein
MKKEYQSQDQQRQNRAAGNIDSSSDHAIQAKGIAPPSFRIESNNWSVQKKESEPAARTNSNQTTSTAYQSAVSADTLQRASKTEYKSLPETLGPTEKGEIAVKGEGDANAFSPSDINQGSIGDCYFLAALAGIAHTNPNLLKNAISKNGDGTYTVKLYKKEITKFLFWERNTFTSVDIKIYPTFPKAADAVDTANPSAASNPAHAHGGDKDSDGNTELWVRLVEKAYALMRDSYKIIGSGGLGAEALEALTGKEHEERVLDDGYKARIIKAVKNNIATEVGTTKSKIGKASKEFQKFALENDIVGGHAYTVMAADKDKIQVRNPWGTGASNTTPEMTWDQFDALFNQYSNKK